ncbi:MAG: imelysin family protein [Stanieria sp.]
MTVSSGCSNNSTTSNLNQQVDNDNWEAITNGRSKELERGVVRDFTDRVVIPTYELLVERTDELVNAVNGFVSNPQDKTLQTARQAWLTTREPWERSETFAFGPAESLGYDGDLDDWPVNETDIAAILNSKDSITPEYVKELETTQKGFHAIELLLFGENNDKQAIDFNPRELEYLKVLTTSFQQTVSDLTTSWTEGVEGNPSYKEVFATAGENNNSVYPTVNAAVEEIVQGMLGCLDEVANEKIGEPLETRENIGFESRFSHSSLNDFANNLRGVENAYLSKVAEAGTNGQSISNLVVIKANPQLDRKIKQELKVAIETVNAIPSSIETQIGEQETITKMETAKKAILTLHDTIEQKVLPLVQS